MAASKTFILLSFWHVSCVYIGAIHLAVIVKESVCLPLQGDYLLEEMLNCPGRLLTANKNVQIFTNRSGQCGSIALPLLRINAIFS